MIKESAAVESTKTSIRFELAVEWWRTIKK